MPWDFEALSAFSNDTLIQFKKGFIIIYSGIL